MSEAHCVSIAFFCDRCMVKDAKKCSESKTKWLALLPGWIGSCLCTTFVIRLWGWRGRRASYFFVFFAESFLELQSCPLEHFVVRRAQSLFLPLPFTSACDCCNHCCRCVIKSVTRREMFLLYFLLNVASYHFSLIWVSVLVLLLEPPKTVRRMSELVGMRHWPHLSASKEQSIRNCRR